MPACAIHGAALCLCPDLVYGGIVPPGNTAPPRFPQPRTGGTATDDQRKYQAGGGVAVCASPANGHQSSHIAAQYRDTSIYSNGLTVVCNHDFPETGREKE